MDRKRPVTGLWKAAAVVMAVVLCLVVLSSALQPPDPNAEMGETAEEAMEMARDARDDAEAARRRGSTIRVVALVVGVAVPLVVAYLIYRLSEQSGPGPEEVLEAMEEEGLLDQSVLGEGKLESARHENQRDRKRLPEDQDSSQ